MRTRPELVTTVLVLVILLSSTALFGQRTQIRIQFEVDGKPSASPREIEFHAPGGQLLAIKEIKGDSFEAPPVTSEKVNVILRFASRTMDFQQIPKAFFEGHWRVGIDTAPFDQENARTVPGKTNKIKEFWYIVFDPPNAEAIRTTVAVPR